MMPVCSQQMMETEHLMTALLEQPKGLTRRILTFQKHSV